MPIVPLPEVCAHGGRRPAFRGFVRVLVWELVWVLVWVLVLIRCGFARVVRR
ncbi:MAG: hypothetical protein WBP61_02615 [Nocardioides sp.]